MLLLLVPPVLLLPAHTRGSLNAPDVSSPAPNHEHAPGSLLQAECALRLGAERQSSTAPGHVKAVAEAGFGATTELERSSANASNVHFETWGDVDEGLLHSQRSRRTGPKGSRKLASWPLRIGEVRRRYRTTPWAAPPRRHVRSANLTIGPALHACRCKAVLLAQ